MHSKLAQLHMSAEIIWQQQISQLALIIDNLILKKHFNFTFIALKVIYLSYIGI